MEYTELLVIDKEDFDELKLDKLEIKMTGNSTGSITGSLNHMDHIIIFKVYSYGAKWAASMFSECTCTF